MKKSPKVIDITENVTYNKGIEKLFVAAQGTYGIGQPTGEALV